jgi:hypothetical protein
MRQSLLIFTATCLYLVLTAAGSLPAVRNRNQASRGRRGGAEGTVSRRLSPSPACEFDFKVYVYPLASTAPSLPSVRLAEEARRNGSYHVCVGCIYEQFALEYIMLDFFSQFCGRTYDPHEADFFYLPLARDIEFRIQKMKNNNKKPTMTENALIQALEKNDTRLWKQLFQVTDHFWHRHGGADHIIGE